MSLQARQETIRVRLYRLRHNAQLKGKHYIQTILDSFSWYIRAIPFTRDRAIDAARGLYQYFLCHREIARIVSFDHGTDFNGKVYKKFYAQMSITQELHCPWQLKNSGNIERQHRTMKNALDMLFEHRNCEWTDTLESIASSVNATIISPSDVSPHYAISGHHRNIGLPKLLSK